MVDDILIAGSNTICTERGKRVPDGEIQNERPCFGAFLVFEYSIQMQK